jgi:hypothetical protein
MKMNLPIQYRTHDDTLFPKVKAGMVAVQQQAGCELRPQKSLR